MDECRCDNCDERLLVGDEALETQLGTYCCYPCRDEQESHNDGLMDLRNAYPEEDYHD